MFEPCTTDNQIEISKGRSMLAEQVKDILVGERVRLGLTQKDVAERMGVHVTFVQKIEGNVGDRQASAFDRYATALGIKLEVSLKHEAVQSRR
jgi:ribosome-binding protein aMBF1 (putative translation factor)